MVRQFKSFGNHGHHVLHPKEEGEIIFLIINAQFNRLHLCWCGDALGPLELVTCTSGKASLVLKDCFFNLL